MYLFVGLGNHGKEYEYTRHNMGFLAVDSFMELTKSSYLREDFKGIYGFVQNPLFKSKIIVYKPYTFMNLSGTGLVEIASYFKISIDDVVVIYDEMSIPEGKIKLRLDGKSNGHKGMQNIIDIFKTDKIKRIKIGIGEPNIDPVSYVLGKPSDESLIKINKAIDNASEALKIISSDSFEKAMNIFNTRN